MMAGKHFRSEIDQRNGAEDSSLVQKGGAAADRPEREVPSAEPSRGKATLVTFAVLLALVGVSVALYFSSQKTSGGAVVGDGPGVLSAEAAPNKGDEGAPAEEASGESPSQNTPESWPVARYAVRINDVWQPDAEQGETAGSPESNELPLQALRVSVSGWDDERVQYCVGDLSGNWSEWVSGGQEVGLENLSALRVSLTGDDAESYRVWYSVRIANEGWLGWTSNGNVAGASGADKLATAFRVQILPKDEAAPGPEDSPFVEGSTSVSGDEALDSILEEIVANHTGTGEDALRNSYDYMSSSFYYTKENETTEGDWSVWSVEYAKEMYWNGKGNCYRFASLHCWIARYLGYDAIVQSGKIPTSQGLSPHGWVEIWKDDMAYVCDADMHKFKQDLNLFMVPYGETPYIYYHMDETPFTTENAVSHES